MMAPCELKVKYQKDLSELRSGWVGAGMPFETFKDEEKILLMSLRYDLGMLKQRRKWSLEFSEGLSEANKFLKYISTLMPESFKEDFDKNSNKNVVVEENFGELYLDYYFVSAKKTLNINIQINKMEVIGFSIDIKKSTNKKRSLLEVAKEWEYVSDWLVFKSNNKYEILNRETDKEDFQETLNLIV